MEEKAKELYGSEDLTPERKQAILDGAHGLFGPYNETIKGLEALAGLMKALSKSLAGTDSAAAVRIQMAKAYVALDQLELVFGSAQPLVKDELLKLERLLYGVRL